jgi:F0F1-type ATP synthase membrane subunit a
MTKDLLLFYVSWSREAFEHILLKFQGLGENKKQKNKKTKKKRRVILFFFNFSLVTLFVYISNVIPIPSFPPSPVSMRCSHPPTHSHLTTLALPFAVASSLHMDTPK